MEEQFQSSFPTPPSFYKFYKEGVEGGPKPPTPIKGQYQMFGITYPVSWF